MAATQRVILKRYWRNRNGEQAAATFDGDSDLEDIDTATAGRTVLLAPPGAGKTTELEQLALRKSDRVRVVSLGAATEVRLHFKIGAAIGEIVDRAGGGSRPILALDSLDETALTTTQLAGLFEEILLQLPPVLRLVIACRSAGWSPGVGHVLREKYNRVAIYDLAPLRDVDIVGYAESAGIDGREFLEAVNQSMVRPLATDPNSLGFLLDDYVLGGSAGHSLPQTQQELYERTCIRLVEEPNPRRLSPSRPQDTSKLIATVGHLAVLGLFCRRSTFVLIGRSANDELTMQDCLPAGIRSMLSGQEVE